MNDEQFAALAELLRLRKGEAQECARLVLVECLPVPEAARRAGVSYQAGHNAVQRCRRGLELARRAIGVPTIFPRNLSEDQ